MLILCLPQVYPSVMVTTAMNDDRVPYWLPLKWVARLRDQLSHHAQGEKPLVVCHVKYYGGHSETEGVYHRIEKVLLLHSLISFPYCLKELHIIYHFRFFQSKWQILVEMILVLIPIAWSMYKYESFCWRPVRLQLGSFRQCLKSFHSCLIGYFTNV